MTVMKHIRISLLALVMGVFAVIASCSGDDDLYNQLPPEIAAFVSRYYPNSRVDSYTHSDNGYHVRLAFGPGFTFDKGRQWTAVNGYGETLPQVFLFDQLPPALYQYLQEGDDLNSVFSVERDPERYCVVLLESTVTYTIKTSQITTQIISPVSAVPMI